MSSGTSATRRSPGNDSFGTPTIKCAYLPVVRSALFTYRRNGRTIGRVSPAARARCLVIEKKSPFSRGVFYHTHLGAVRRGLCFRVLSTKHEARHVLRVSR